MKILFELDNGAYVVEVLPKRLYAKVEAHTDIPTYSSTASSLLNRGSFHEYRKKDKKLAFELEDIIRYDLEGSYDKTKEIKQDNEHMQEL